MKRQNRIAFFNILSTVVLKGSAFFTGMLFTRLLGGSGYGSLKLYNILVSIVAVVFSLQTQTTLANARVEYPEEAQRGYQSSAMTLSALFFGLCTGIVLLFLKPISSLLDMTPALVLLMLFQAFGTFCVEFLNKKNVYEFRAGWNMILSMVMVLVPLVLAVILILQMPYETRYVGRVIANSVTYGVVGTGVCLWILFRGKTFFHREYWKFCLILALPAVFHNLSDLILNQMDSLMLNALMDTAAVGYYGNAWNFANFLFILFQALNNIWCAYFFEEMKTGERESMLAKSRNFLEVFTILACGFILLAPEVYHLYAPREFWVATILLPLFVSGYYVNFLCTFPVNFEYYHKKPKVVAAITISSSLLNLVLNYVFIKAMGMAGAAVATLASHCLQLTLHHIYAARLGRQDYPFPLKLWLGYPLVFCAVLAVVFLLPDAWFIRWPLGAVLGIFMLLRVKQRKVLI
ncbi:MAG: oligosaccharide flippase family protein [Eubacteriales bacterium]|nr:oligosaccharide flippase family protein [Eubacteriales bacterium]